jgi:hypothetical protein
MPQQKIIDTCQVVSAQVLAVGIAIENYNTYLTTISLLLAIAYTTWKWVKDYKKK